MISYSHSGTHVTFSFLNSTCDNGDPLQGPQGHGGGGAGMVCVGGGGGGGV